MENIKNFVKRILFSIKFLFTVVIYEVAKLLWLVLWRATLTTIVGGLPLVSIYVLLEFTIRKHPISFAGIYILTPLAILIAFSSLLYGRSRALNPEKISHSVKSADLIFRGAIYYTFALVFGLIVYSVNYMLITDFHMNVASATLSILYSPSIFAICMSYIDFYHGLLKIWPEIKID